MTQRQQAKLRIALEKIFRAHMSTLSEGEIHRHIDQMERVFKSKSKAPPEPIDSWRFQLDVGDKLSQLSVSRSGKVRNRKLLGESISLQTLSLNRLLDLVLPARRARPSLAEMARANDEWLTEFLSSKNP